MSRDSFTALSLDLIPQTDTGSSVWTLRIGDPRTGGNSVPLTPAQADELAAAASRIAGVDVESAVTKFSSIYRQSAALRVSQPNPSTGLRSAVDYWHWNGESHDED